MTIHGFGRLTDTAKLFTYGANKTGASFTIACKEYVGRDAQTQEAKYETSFLDVTVYGNDAEYVKKFIGKGDEVFVEGTLKTNNWTDKESGAKRSKLYMNADQVKLTSKVGANGASTSSANENAPTPSAQAIAVNVPEPEAQINEDEIPF